MQILIEQVATLDDQRAFGALFNLFYKQLKRFAVAIVKDQQLAEEVVCDVFVKLWKSRTKLLQVENINSYLYIATKNMSIKRNSQIGAKGLTEIEYLEIEPVFPDRNPEEILLNAELIKFYEKAVNGLPPKCQVIYRLAKQDGLKLKEIADILNLSVKTIDAQLAIAVKRVTKAVQFYYNLN